MIAMSYRTVKLCCTRNWCVVDADVARRPCRGSSFSTDVFSVRHTSSLGPLAPLSTSGFQMCKISIFPHHYSNRLLIMAALWNSAGHYIFALSFLSIFLLLSSFFPRVLAALLHGTLAVGVSQTAALNRGRHPYSAGRPSHWALAHISSLI